MILLKFSELNIISPKVAFSGSDLAKLHNFLKGLGLRSKNQKVYFGNKIFISF